MSERHHRNSPPRSPAFTLGLAAVVFVGATFVSSGALAPREAQASVAIAMSLDDLARGSSVIARITPLDHESVWENGRIITYSRVRVDDVVAGSTPSSARELRVRTLGGRVGNIGQTVEGEAALTASEPSIVFLAAARSDHTTDVVVVGRAQGQLRVRRDTHGQEVVRLGGVGEIIARQVRPPLRPAGTPVIELQGAPVASVVTDAKRAWEAGHAH